MIITEQDLKYMVRNVVKAVLAEEKRGITPDGRVDMDPFDFHLKGVGGAFLQREGMKAKWVCYNGCIPTKEGHMLQVPVIITGIVVNSNANDIKKERGFLAADLLSYPEMKRIWYEMENVTVEYIAKKNENGKNIYSIAQEIHFDEALFSRDSDYGETVHELVGNSREYGRISLAFTHKFVPKEINW